MNPKFIIGGIILILFLYWISKTNNQNQKSQDSNIMEENPSEKESSRLQLVNFCTDWCGFSKQFLPVWKQVVNKINSDPTINITTKRVKCDASPDHDRVCNLYNIKGYPTVKLIGDDFSEEYTGRRNLVDIMAFVKSYNKK